MFGRGGKQVGGRVLRCRRNARMGDGDDRFDGWGALDNRALELRGRLLTADALHPSQAPPLDELAVGTARK